MHTISVTIFAGSMNPISNVLSLLNDWRDTIFYSFAAVLGLTLLILGGGWSLTLFVITGAAFFREILRTLAWQIADLNAMRAQVPKEFRVSIFLCKQASHCIYFWVGFIFCATSDLPTFFRHPIEVYILFPVILFMLIIITNARNSMQMFGGLHLEPIIWWKILFDFPRKQPKPPKRKKESKISKAIERLVEAMKGLVPEPVPAHTREIVQ